MLTCKASAQREDRCDMFRDQAEQQDKYWNKNKHSSF